MTPSYPLVFGWTRPHLAVVVTVVAVLLPLIIHFIPWSGPRPLGALLLPAFWSALVAVYLLDWRFGLVLAVLTPAINLVFTGLPGLERVSGQSLELIWFVLVLALLRNRWPPFGGNALAAYFVAQVAMAMMGEIFPRLHRGGSALSRILGNCEHAAPGLLVLLVLNIWLVVQLSERGSPPALAVPRS